MKTRKLAAIVAAAALFVAGMAVLAMQTTPTSAAPNLLTNPDFDTDIAGWTPFTSVWTWNPTEDSAGSPTSGALEVSITTPPPGINTGGVQCVSVTANTAYQVSADIKMPSANQPAGTFGNVIWVFFDGANCTGIQSGNGGLAGVNTADDTWHSLSNTVNSPGGVVSMWFYVNINGQDPAGPEQSHILYDNFDFSLVGGPTPTATNTTSPTITNTPGAATSTASATASAAKTHTPTPAATTGATQAAGTPTPGAPQGTSTPPGGGSGAGVIGPPDTGSGPGGGAGTRMPQIALALGGLLLVVGWAVRRNKHRQM